MTSFEPGELFAGRYKIVRRLGAGGMGAVYLACDPLEEDFLVALKVLNPGQAQNATARERFRNEITASYKINHPNVVKAYEYFDAADVQAYALEYVDGGDLMERMNSGTPSAAECIDILTQVADALTAIHAAAIIHRDLKPENILLTKKGVVKITDFGVARLKDARTLTSAGSMVGTPKFLAPEYIEMGECDARGDIFALGVIAYELLCGEAPYGNESNPNKMLERLKVAPRPLDQKIDGLPPGLSAIVMKAMETRVAKRYQSAHQLLEDLRTIKAGSVPDWIAPQQISSATEDPSTERQIGPVFSLGNLPPDKTPEPANDRPQREASFGVLSPAILPNSSWSFRFGTQHLAITALLGTLVASIGVAYRSFEPTLTHLPEGSYVGVVNGVFGEGSRTPLGISRTPEATVMILGRAGCAPIQINAASKAFSCGDLSFEFSVEAMTETSAVGTVRERSWRTTGTWSVSRR